MRWGLYLLGALALAGCSNGAEVARVEAEQDAACRARRNGTYEECRAYYRVAAEYAQQERVRHNLAVAGDTMQGVAAALGGVSPPPAPAPQPLPRAVQCQAFGNRMICQ